MHPNKKKFDAPNNKFFTKGLEDSNLKNTITTEEVIVWFDEVPNEEKVEEIYWIEPPFCFASISKRNGEKVYETYEATEQDSDVKNFVLNSVGYELSEIDIDYPTLFDACNSMLDMIENRQLDNKNYADLYNARKDSSGFMMLYPYTKDFNIENLSYNSSEPLFAYHSKYGSIPSNLKISDKEVNEFVTQLLDNFDQDTDSKLVEKKLTENVSIVVTFSSENNELEDTTFTLKTDNPYTFTPVDLYESGTYSSTAISYLWMAVDNDMSVLFAGGTSSGKTSTLEAILLFTGENQKIASVEERREISIPHRNWIPNYSLNKENLDNSDLLESSLRQRPKYTVLGEIRSGSEAQTLFQAISTGHTSYSTMHADSVDSVINRLTNPPVNVPKQMLMGIDIICVQDQLRVNGRSESSRKVKDIREVVSLDNNNQFRSKKPFYWDPKTDDLNDSVEDSYVIDEISRIDETSTEDVIKELNQREKIIEEMSRSNIRDAKSVRDIITTYQKSPDLVMRKLKNGNLEKII